MKTLYIVRSEEYEADGFFINGKLVHWFFNNDAMWRSEYMNGLIEEMGWEVKEVSYSGSRLQEVLDAHIKAII